MLVLLFNISLSSCRPPYSIIKKRQRKEVWTMAGKRETNRVSYYFLKEKKILAMTALSGILYNLGLVAVSWFEGHISQYLADILEGTRQPSSLIFLHPIHPASSTQAAWKRWGSAGMRLRRHAKRESFSRWHPCVQQHAHLLLHHQTLPCRIVPWPSGSLHPSIYLQPRTHRLHPVPDQQDA